MAPMPARTPSSLPKTSKPPWALKAGSCRTGGPRTLPLPSRVWTRTCPDPISTTATTTCSAPSIWMPSMRALWTKWCPESCSPWPGTALWTRVSVRRGPTATTSCTTPTRRPRNTSPWPSASPPSRCSSCRMRVASCPCRRLPRTLRPSPWPLLARPATPRTTSTQCLTSGMWGTITSLAAPAASSQRPSPRSSKASRNARKRHPWATPWCSLCRTRWKMPWWPWKGRTLPWSAAARRLPSPWTATRSRLTSKISLPRSPPTPMSPPLWSP
mmetsp:Transcript_15148/g.44821  ORF Transcript_15148/g.44821 Transcript_15148/m.44821 type:complete len:271 (+) Transcript_15148:90-902(+)